IRIQDPLELLLLKDKKMVEAFLSDTPQETLTDGIGLGGMNRRCEQFDATGRRHLEETGSILAVVITDQILWRLPIGSRFSELLRDPRIGRRAGHAHVDDLPRLLFEDEERKERPKEQVGHLQEVTRPDLSGVVAQKGCPLLPSWRL